MQNSSYDLCIYRIKSAIETLGATKLCIDNKHYKDAINRGYYATFYAIKAVLAMEKVDFKKHKDVVAYFNKMYVATEVFDKAIGRMLAQLQLKREKSDYDDFYIASKEESELQYQNAIHIIEEVKKYLFQKYKIEI